MKIIHISDLHFPNHFGTEKLIDKIISHYKEDQVKPIVVCTGDILDTPSNNNSNYLEASKILTRLKTNNFNVLICPGNHDLKKGGLKKRKQIHANLIKFSRYYSPILPANSNIHGEEKNNLLEYPITHKYQDHYFIGLNSMTYQPKSAKGMLGDEQLDKLELEIKKIKETNEDPKIIIYLHHNPMKFHVDVRNIPDFGDRIITNNLKLIDRTSFLKKIEGVNVLLFGHLHWNQRQEKFEDKYNINCIQLTGGSTTKVNQSWTEINTFDYSTIEHAY